MKYSLQIMTIIFGLLSIALLYELLQPIRESTWPVNKKFEFTDLHTEEFRIDYHAPYKYLLEIIRGEEDIDTSQIEVLLSRGEIILVDTVFSKLHSYLSIKGSFSAESGDHCFMKIIDKVNRTSIKKVTILVDVNSGGPSVGIAFAKALRPYFWGVFAFLSLCTIVSGYNGYIK